MATMNISLPDDMRSAVDAQTEARGYGTSSEYVRDLIRRDLDRQALRALLDEGRASEPGEPMTKQTFQNLRNRAARIAGNAV
ncbi:ribbon-helix-helix domain-containing protein [Seohaeicola zhoushanensis]|uniref:Addiction module antitoxin n=1 Tax=Seohaeicola zhoushanensis TaxID=1569283 RepID=A0A8J3H3C9_9RHOB|nr:type II toxin-antitoxin system ParD family antitoxin [Seohaeicola zhoushanensis]GHF76101.1 addiction module antitoxin [Seohaeicola zhoushanensis]